MGDTQVFMGFYACALRLVFDMILLWGQFWKLYSDIGRYSEVFTGISGSLLEQGSFDMSLKRQKIFCSLLHLQSFKHLMKNMILFIFPFPSRHKKNKTCTITFSSKPFFMSASICDINIVKIWVNFWAIIIVFPIIHLSIGNYLPQTFEFSRISLVSSTNVGCLSHFKLERKPKDQTKF